MRSWLPFIMLLIIWGTMLNQTLRLPLRGWQWFTMLSALIYTLAIAYLCFTPTQYNWGGPHKIFYHVLGVPCNIIPFQALSPDFFLNIVMTVPAGIYWYLLSDRHDCKFVLMFGILLGISIETTQFLCDLFFHVERFVDIDDVITNTAGVLVGFYTMVILKTTILADWIAQLSIKFVKL